MSIEKPLAVLLAVGVVCLPLPGNGTHAGCRAVVHHRHQQQAAVVFQPVYQQPYWYAVGQNYQIAAIVQETLKAQQLLAAQPQQLTAPCPDGTCQTPQTLPLTTAPDRWALVRSSCVACHESNQDAKLSLDMSDLDALTCEQKLNCIKQLVDGAMPRGKPLDPSLLGDLIGTFSGSDKVGQ